MPTLEEIVAELKAKAKPENLAGMQRFGITVSNRLGLSVPDMRRLAKQTGKDHRLALELWKTGIAEARIVAAMVDEPSKLTASQMEDWVKDFDSWDVCDQVCMNLFDKSPLAWQKVFDWAEREEEFIKRTAFSLIACLAVHDKKSADERFIEFLPVIVRGATDERNFVKKAVNWALRQVGKKNAGLNAAALETAREAQKLNSKAARWIAADAIRELESEPVKRKLGIK